MATLAIMIEAQEGSTWERWTRLIDAAEELGFDSLWRSDHLFSTVASAVRNSMALWPALTMVAARSRRIRFGQLVSPVSFRNPVMLAHNAVALDRLSGGRYVLGIGAGWNQREHDAFGFDLPPVKERMDRLEEAIQVIKHLHTGTPTTFAGAYFRLEDAVMLPTPTRAEGVPMLIGGSGPHRTLRMVASYADEWNTSLLPLDSYRQRIDALERHCEQVGRDPATIRRSLMLGHLLAATRGELLERAARIQQILPSIGELPVEAVPARLRERGWMVGTPEEAIEQLGHWTALGVQRFMLQTFDQDDIDALALIARTVMPAVA